MAKPFIVKELVENRIVMRTTDSGSQVILDQGPLVFPNDSTIQIVTDLFSKNIRLSTEPPNEIKIGGGNLFFTTTNGNASTVAAQIFQTGQQVRQTNLTVLTEGTLAPAAAVYNELNNTDVPGINEMSRVLIEPDAAGTSIHSMIIHVGDPNIPGRVIRLQNTGTNVGQTLTLVDQSGAGTAGGLFLGPGDYVIPAGGGADVVFSLAANAWLVQGI